MKSKVQVHINNLEVDEYHYSFEYIIFVNDKLICVDCYSHNHVWQGNYKGFEQKLKDGMATAIVLEDNAWRLY